jgi:hypothetical protein
MSTTTGSDDGGAKVTTLGLDLTRRAAAAALPRARRRGDSRHPASPSSAGPLALDPTRSPDAHHRAEFEALVRRQLELLGEDPDRDGLQKTPERVVKALAWLTRGHEVDVRAVIGDAVFEETHESMVMVHRAA